jgi:hypothetical protein
MLGDVHLEHQNVLRPMPKWKTLTRSKVVKPATAKAKGRATENQAVAWLRENGYPYAERRHLAGEHDLGDITGMPGICVEVKSAAQWAPVRWLRETRAEMNNSRSPIGFVMARPKGGTNVDDWVIMMHPDTLLSLLTDAGWRTPVSVRPEHPWTEVELPL